MRVTVGSVIYHEALQYIPDFFESLVNQDKQDYNILLLNDNIPEKDLNEIIIDLPNDFLKHVHIIDYTNKNYTPIELRVELLYLAKKEGINSLILLDCDDTASVNRVSKVSESFDEKYTFYYNDIVDFENRIVIEKIPSKTDSYKDIDQYNYLGLSNTALNLSRINLDFILSLKQCTSPIFDWYFYNRLLIEGHTGIKVNSCYTKYRIHDENIAGRTICSEIAIKKELAIKKEIYSLLSQYCSYYDGLYHAIQSNKYKLNKNSNNSPWWSLIKVKSEDYI